MLNQKEQALETVRNELLETQTRLSKKELAGAEAGPSQFTRNLLMKKDIELEDLKQKLSASIDKNMDLQREKSTLKSQLARQQEETQDACTETTLLK